MFAWVKDDVTGLEKKKAGLEANIKELEQRGVLAAIGKCGECVCFCVEVDPKAEPEHGDNGKTSPSRR